MSGEDIFGLIIMVTVSFGCGVLFYAMGLLAVRSKKPFGFWTGKEVKPETISDIPAYNRENGKMWKLYSLPWFVTGVLYFGGIRFPALQWLSVALLIAAGTAGIGWLICRYNRIFKKYSVK